MRLDSLLSPSPTGQRQDFGFDGWKPVRLWERQNETAHTPPSLVIFTEANHLMFAGCSMPSYDRTLRALALW